jgi:hypothetical protein
MCAPFDGLRGRSEIVAAGFAYVGRPTYARLAGIQRRTPRLARAKGASARRTLGWYEWFTLRDVAGPVVLKRSKSMYPRPLNPEIAAASQNPGGQCGPDATGSRLDENHPPVTGSLFHEKEQTAPCAFLPYRNPIRKVALGSRSVGLPRVLGVGSPIGCDAYAGVSSTMRPSLQPYLASKSAFTVAPS